jgi:hypothetical protein
MRRASRPQSHVFDPKCVCRRSDEVARLSQSRPAQICVLRPRTQLERVDRWILLPRHPRPERMLAALLREPHLREVRIRIHPILVIQQPDPFMRRIQQVRASRAPGGALALTLAPFLIRPAYAARRASCTAWSCDPMVVTYYPRSATRIVTTGRDKSISSKRRGFTDDDRRACRHLKTEKRVLRYVLRARPRWCSPLTRLFSDGASCGTSSRAATRGTSSRSVPCVSVRCCHDLHVCVGRREHECASSSRRYCHDRVRPSCSPSFFFNSLSSTPFNLN